MIIYNVTVKVDASIAKEWLHWMKTEHIPEIMKTKCFTGYRILHLLGEHESEGSTYTIQYESPEYAAYEKYIQQHANSMRSEALNKWGERFVAFRTIMEVV